MSGIVSTSSGFTTQSGDTGFQVIEGFGCTIRAFSHPDTWGLTSGTPGVDYPLLTTAQRDSINDALFLTSGIGLTRVRTCEPTIFNGQFIENPNDNADPNSYNAAGFNFAGPRLDDLATQFGEARARYPGTKVWLSPLYAETWMTGLTAANPNPTEVAEWAEWLLALVRRYNVLGQPLSYLCLSNEPSYTRIPMSGAFIRDVIKNLGPRLSAEGLLIPIVLPDDNHPAAAASVINTVMADAVARPYVGFLATHSYDNPESAMALVTALGATWNLPVWQTEMTGSTLSSMAGSVTGSIGLAIMIHNMLTLYNCTAFDMFLAAMGGTPDNQGNVMITLTNSGTTYTGYTIIKHAHYLGQYARYVRPGMRRVAISSSNSSVKVSAYRNGTARTIVVVNPTGGALTPTFTSIDALNKVTTLSVTRSSPTETWASQSAQSCADGQTIAPTLPATSVTTFVGTAS